MGYSSQIVRASVDVFFISDVAYSTGDCFYFDAVASPDIVSFSASSSCDIADCGFDGSNFVITLTADLATTDTITITNFNYLDYLYLDSVTFAVGYRSGCGTTDTSSTIIFIDTSQAITIAQTDISISSDSVVVGATGNTLTVAVTDVTFPAIGQIILTVPKLIGTTKAINTGSCSSFTATIITATCDSVVIDANSDEVTISFTATEGTRSPVLTFSDFDNPFSTSEFSGFAYDVKELGSDGLYYRVSYGESLAMDALTTPYTLDAILTLTDGTIEEIDTLQIEFVVSNGQIATDFEFELVLPTDFGFDTASQKSTGKGCFGRTSGTANSYQTISSTYSFTFPDDNSYQGGSVTATGIGHTSAMDLDCGITISGIINPEFVATTSTLMIYLYDSLGGIVAQQITGLTILDSQLTAGAVTLDSFTSDNTEIQALLVTYTLIFTPAHNIDADTSIIIDWPTDLVLDTGCTATSATMDTTAGVCTPGSSTITFSTPFSSSKGAGIPITVIITTGTNQDSVRDAGTIQIDVYSKDTNGDSQLKDQYSGDSGYVTTAGAIVRDSAVGVDGGITPTSTTTYVSDVVYTFFIETEHDVASGGFIIITLPSTIGTTGSGTNANCLFDGVTPEECSVDDTLLTITITLSSTQSITGAVPIEVAFGGLLNPRTFENSGYIVIETQDSLGNQIDSGAEQFSVAMDTMSEMTGFTLTLADTTNLAETNYTIEFASTVPIYDGDTLYMTFPSDVSLVNTVECDIDYEITTDITAITCTNTGQDLTVDITTLSTSGATGEFSFILMDVTNPETTLGSGLFTSIFIEDNAGYSAIQYTTDLIAETDTAAPLDVTLTQSSYSPGEEATYTFEFTPNSAIPEDGIIILTYPDSISLTSRLGCLIKGPRTSSNLCTVSTVSQKIEIERAFIGWTSGYQKSMTIEKEYFINMDDETAATPGTFTITIYTDVTETYEIDAVTVDLPPLLDCTWPCKSCLTSDTSYCLSCFTSGSYVFLQDNSCQLTCDDTWTANGSSPKVCVTCDDSCVDCVDEGNDEDKFRCTECSEDYDMEYVNDNRCFVECGFGYYEVNDEICGKCLSPCADCTENYYTCTACLEETGLPFALDGGCIEECPDGYGAINGVCYSCKSPCSTCVDSTTSCTSCDGKGGSSWLFIDKCYENCPDGTTANTATNTCTGCLSGCDLCSSTNQTHCLLCTSPLYVLNGECLASCPDGYSESYDGKSCVEGLLDLPRLYFPHLIAGAFIFVSVMIGYFRHNDTLILSNFIAIMGFVEGVAFGAQMIIAFVLSADKYGAISFVGVAINLGLNIAWFFYFKKNMKDPSFNLWQKDHSKATKIVQILSLVLSFKLTRLHFAKFAGFDYFRAGFTDPNVMWKPLLWFTIIQGVGVYSLFVIQDIVALDSMRWGSQLYICVIETFIICLVMTLLQIIELLRIKQYLGDIYNPLPGETNATMDPLNPELRSKLLSSIINKVKGQRGNFLNNNLDELLDMFGPRKCQSDREREKPEWGEDEREVKSWPVSPRNEKDYQDLLNQPKFKPFGFMENIDQPDNVIAEGKPANPLGKTGKDFSDGWGQTRDSEFQDLLGTKKGDLMTEGDSDDEYRKKRAKQKSKRGRPNKYMGEINAEDDQQNDSNEDFEDDLDDGAIKEEDEEDEVLDEKTRGRGKQVAEESPTRGAAPSGPPSPDLKELERQRKEEERQKAEEAKFKAQEDKKRLEDEKKMKKEEEARLKKEKKQKEEDDKKKKKEEEVARKEAEKQAKVEAKRKAEEDVKFKKEADKKVKEDAKQLKEQQKLQDKQMNNADGDLTAERRAQETIDADGGNFFQEEAMGTGDRGIAPQLMTSSTPDGKRSDLRRPKEDTNVMKLSDEPEVQIPPNPKTRNFNESDILGSLERDKKGNVIVPDELKDQKSRQINPKGYLVDANGNIIEKEKGDIMFNKEEVDEMGEIPAPFCVEKFNFNPFTVKAKGSPKRGQKVNDKGWLTDTEGNIIEGRFGRVKFDKRQLTKDGDLPKMFNYNGRRFDIQDVMGDIDMLPNGDLNLKKDSKTGQFVDKKGRPVNERGYLIDHEGNVISKTGQKIFDEFHLENGEIPKIFPFTKFNTKNVLGNFEMDPVGVPILGKNRDGHLIDSDGRRVNKQGYLIDDQENVIDKRTGGVMFDNNVLDRDGDIPKVFRTGLLRSDTNSSLQKIISDIERNNDQSEFDHEERVLNSHINQHGTPNAGHPKRKLSGQTSEGSEMGITPTDYNFLNQRFDPDLDNVGEVIEEENEDGSRRKRRVKKKPQPQKTYVDPRGVEMATAYGGPIPKPKARKTVLGQKPMVNDKAKERLSKLANSISGFQEPEGSRRGSTNNPALDHHQREQALKAQQMEQIRRKKLAVQAKKAKAAGMEQPDFEKMFGKDIDQFLEDSEWEIESFERMSQYSRGSARSFSDPKKLRGLESIYLQRLETSSKKHGISKKNPAKFRNMQDRTVDPAEAMHNDKGLTAVPGEKPMSMQKGSAKNSDQGNIFAGKAKMYDNNGGWMQN